MYRDKILQLINSILKEGLTFAVYLDPRFKEISYNYEPSIESPSVISVSIPHNYHDIKFIKKDKIDYTEILANKYQDSFSFLANLAQQLGHHQSFTGGFVQKENYAIYRIKSNKNGHINNLSKEEFSFLIEEFHRSWDYAELILEYLKVHKKVELEKLKDANLSDLRNSYTRTH